tara:strand:- start:463 stop:708 length:246 start_codon:yes stop_codon:yes gene_type:complete
MELHNTGYGKRLFESDIPGIRKALERIADSLEDKKLKVLSEMIDTIADDFESQHSSKVWKGDFLNALDELKSFVKIMLIKK